MKKKNLTADDSDNEFDVDEPEELQENSDDDWAPESTGKKGAKRSSTTRGRKTPNKKKKADSEEEEDEEEDEAPAKKKKATPKSKPGAKAKAATKKKAKDEDDEDEEGDEEEDEELDEEVEDEEEEDEEEDEEEANDGNQKTPKEYSSGAFVVLKTDFDNGGNPPLWKIDGKALLQKYVPFEQDGKTLYKNTSVYSGWTISNKDQYYPATVTFKQQTRKEHIVEFQRQLINQ